MEDNVWALVGQGHERARLVEGGDVASFASAVKHPDDWVMPDPGSVTARFRRASGCVVAVKTDFTDGKRGFVLELEWGIGERFAVRTLALLTLGLSYLKKKSARSYDCEMCVGEGRVPVGGDGGEGVDVTAIGMVHCSVPGVVWGIDGVAQGSRLSRVGHVGVGGQGVLELAKGWGWGGHGFGGSRG